MSEVFEIIGKISEISTIATRSKIREITDLREKVSHGRWGN
ncbi:MAG: hypothetical protein WKF71_07500 [Pyrinomonadaceae bacterium]|jgi:hypothetical protein